jgi:hypothetical protein
VRRLSRYIVSSRAIAVIALFIVTDLPEVACGAASPFTVVALPDTQVYSAFRPDIFVSQTQWILGNQTSENIRYVAHQGDIVDNRPIIDGIQPTYNEAQQWANATDAMYRLDNTSPRLPWGTATGNHDFPEDIPRSAGYLTCFGPSHFTGQPWYGGSYECSSYQTFAASGRDYLVLNIQDTWGSGVLDWAQDILNANRGKATIVNVHEYMNSDGRYNQGIPLWDSLVSLNSQIFMVLCGHWGDEHAQISTNAAGKAVYELLADYQDDPMGGNGYMRLLQFDEAKSMIHVDTFSPCDTTDGPGGTYRTDPSSRFDLSMNFSDRLGHAPEPSVLILLSAGAFVALLTYAWQQRRTILGG